MSAEIRSVRHRMLKEVEAALLGVQSAHLDSLLGASGSRVRLSGVFTLDDADKAIEASEDGSDSHPALHAIADLDRKALVTARRTL